MSGWLQKQGHIRKNWKSRWFVLKTKFLFYYKNNQSYHALGAIPLHLATVDPSDLREFCLRILPDPKCQPLFIKAESQEEIDRWYEALRKSSSIYKVAKGRIRMSEMESEKAIENESERRSFAKYRSHRRSPNTSANVSPADPLPSPSSGHPLPPSQFSLSSSLLPPSPAHSSSSYPVRASPTPSSANLSLTPSPPDIPAGQFVHHVTSSSLIFPLSPLTTAETSSKSGQLYLPSPIHPEDDGDVSIGMGGGGGGGGGRAPADDGPVDGFGPVHFLHSQAKAAPTVSAYPSLRKGSVHSTLRSSSFMSQSVGRPTPNARGGDGGEESTSSWTEMPTMMMKPTDNPPDVLKQIEEKKKDLNNDFISFAERIGELLTSVNGDDDRVRLSRVRDTIVQIANMSHLTLLEDVRTIRGSLFLSVCVFFYCTINTTLCLGYV